MTPEEIAKEAKKKADAKRNALETRSTKAGTIVLPSFKNAIIYLQTDDKLMKLFQFNEFAHQGETTRRPFWGDFGAYPKPIHDHDVISLREYLAFEYQVDFSMANLNDAVTRVSVKNSYDPVKDYLTSLIWDGKSRVGNWLTDYLGVVDDDYGQFVGKMTLVGACARIDKPGIKYDYMLILEGEQGIGKSEALKALGGEWFNEMSLTGRDKDTVEKMQGCWIIEVPELAVFKKKEIESLKAFITMNKDKERLPWGRRSVTFPRRNVFIGTINPGSNGYLTDNTGNRRFLPVDCKAINVPKLRSDRDQIWAEAWKLYQDGSPLYLSKDITIKSTDMQASREVADAWQEPIEDYIRGRDRVTSKEIYTDGLKGHLHQFDRMKQMRVCDCLRKANWEKKTFRLQGNFTKGFMRNSKAEPIKTSEDVPWSE